MKKLFTILFAAFLFSIAIMGQNSTNELIVLDYGYGDAEDDFVWGQSGGKCAVKFAPYLNYPFLIVGGSVWISPYFPNGQILGSSFRIEVYDDDGVDGYPNTLLGSMDCIVDSTEWYEFYGFDIIIEDGMFYIAMVQTDMPPDCAGLGVDYESAYNYEMSYVSIPNSSTWEFSGFQNFMIKAFIDTDVRLNEIYNESILIKAHPNPFTTSTIIEYELKEISNIQFTIYNVIGEVVYMGEDRMMFQGKHSFTWAADRLPEGMYYAVLRSEERVSIIKMIKQ